MRITKYFLPILKEDPSDAHVASHRLMLRAGMIRQQNSGIYVWLPLGLKVLKNIEKIIREELNKVGAVEVLLPCIQPADFWIETGRYESYGKEMLRITDRHENKLLFAPTAEDAITDLFRSNVKSYKELPINLYQVQWKFRDEIRPRFGVMRAREFYMKDAYSFDLDKEGAIKSYDQMFKAYINIFKKIGIHAIPVKAETGPIGGDMSQEFHIIAKDGESEIFYDSRLDDLLKAKELDIDEIKKCYAVSDDIYDPKACTVEESSLVRTRGIEVGHIFNFGTKYTEAMNCVVQNKDGKLVHPLGGSYGIGISRLVAAIIEANYDNAGIIWPESIAPFTVSIVCLKYADIECKKMADTLYEHLQKAGLTVLLDDSDSSVGSKFATHDLIGVPWQVVIGPKLAQTNLVELKERKTMKSEQLSLDTAISKLITALSVVTCH
jgi:prolyl-tRNA synthetase